jgi:hypothetical protein
MGLGEMGRAKWADVVAGTIRRLDEHLPIWRHDLDVNAGEYLPLAVRAYTETEKRQRRRRVAEVLGRTWKRPRLVVAFDTETSVDHAQALTFDSIDPLLRPQPMLEVGEEISSEDLKPFLPKGVGAKGPSRW